MTGTREVFPYLECGGCGSLQIADIPADLERHYGGGYYSFGRPVRGSPPKRWIKRLVAAGLLRPDTVGARVLERVIGVPAPLHWVRTAGLGPGARILDVGSGSGQTLVTLAEYGFRSLTGVDPFVPESHEPIPGVRVLRAGLEDVRETFDLVMFHHSFEHLPDPLRSLRTARGLLRPRGTVLIRMPIVGESWRRYGPDWVELDPPRHLHVLSADGMGILAGRAGLRVRRVEYDTTGFELWGSEQYRRGIPLVDPRSHLDGAGDVFGKEEMREFEARARELNRSGGAGRGAFWLESAGAVGGAADHG
ncbi:MAG TPA: class I SAM-dependent methyltransferase [Longimicrobiales bacterium]|nr:class I SAM-dependent methyltransferase [Longimicrobiales bacterium]